MDLNRIRKQIDGVDRELLGLINRRLELVVRAGKLKTEVTDTQREATVLEHVSKQSRGLLTNKFTETIYKEIIAESRRLQSTKVTLIGFQGEHGAFSELAVKQVDENAVAIPNPAFADVFQGVESGVLDYGVVPVENSLGGAVTQVDDLLLDTNLHIVGEISLPVHQCLLSLPETDYRDIRVVYSHPQALSQCRGFIQRNKLEARAHYDTAGAALMLARERPAAAAVIASRLCADIYNLEILKENIEDDSSNVTRFVTLSREPFSGAGNKCSVVFSTAHRPGALLRILKEFSDAEVNLSRIESRPAPKLPGRFAFMLDFLGSDKDPKIKKAMDAVAAETDHFRVLGCYKA